MRIYWILYFVYISSTACYGCINGYARYDDSCYHVSHETENWIDSMTTCKLENANLAVITSQRENAYLHQLLKSHSVSMAWIGATDLDVEGDWVWWPSKARLDYSSWAPSEPNNSGGQEDCALLQANGVWNDGPCHSQQYYICKMPYEGTTEVIG